MVFSHFEPKEHSAGDVIDTALWRFFVVTTTALERKLRDGKQASLSTIEGMASSIRYPQLKEVIDRAILAAT